MAFRVVGISGSLRVDSYNTRLLEAAAANLGEGVLYSRQSLEDLPHYNADLEIDAAPASVALFRAALANADALIVATPEYNYSVPGVLKNAVDWASRPAYQSVLRGLPVGVISASPGALGGARAQLHLKTVLMAAGAYVLPSPDVAVGMVADRIDGEHGFVASTTSYLEAWVHRFVDWAKHQPKAL